LRFWKQIFLVAIIFWCALVANAQTQAPALKLKNTRGATVNLSKYKGKVTLVNFWATWCPPCRAEMPDLIRWQKEFRGKGLRIIGITYPPTSLREVRQFTRSIGVNYPILIGTKKTKALFDPGEAMPLTIIIDREGRIIDRIEGIILREEFEQKVKPLLD
jgi:thiol-disulfide isomerase/thioredoxin